MNEAASLPRGTTDEDRIDRATLVLAGVVILGAVMSILDVTIVNVAIDTLAQRFRPTPSHSGSDPPCRRSSR